MFTVRFPTVVLVLFYALPSQATPDFTGLARCAIKEFYTFDLEYGPDHLKRLKPYLTSPYLKELEGYGDRQRDNEANRGYKQLKMSSVLVSVAQHAGLPLVICALKDKDKIIFKATVIFRPQAEHWLIDRISSSGQSASDLAEAYMRASYWSGVDGYQFVPKTKAERSLVSLVAHYREQIPHRWRWQPRLGDRSQSFALLGDKGVDLFTLIFEKKTAKLLEVTELG